MTEISPGIHRLAVPIPVPHVGFANLYLLVGSEGCALIDAGWNNEDCYQALLAHLRDLGLGLADISTVIITHSHPDHYGLADRLTAESGASLILHLWENALVQERYTDYTRLASEMSELMRANGWPSLSPTAGQSARPSDFATVATADRLLYGGERLDLVGFTLEVVWVPGHAPGHVCLFERERGLLFSGDCVLSETVPTVTYHPQSGGNPLGRFLDAVRDLRSLPARKVLPGHGAELARLSDRVDEIVSAHLCRVELLRGFLGSGGATAHDLAQRLEWSFPGKEFRALSPLYKQLALMETLAMLEYLKAGGRAAVKRKDDVNVYSEC